MGEEGRPFGKRARIILIVIVWIPVAVLLWGFFQWAWWLGVGIGIIAVWFTWDYLKRGNFAGDVEEGLSRGGRLFGEGATEVLKRNED